MVFSKANFDYSMKNIPIPSRKQYIRSLIIKIEDFIQRLRWKKIFFLKKENNNNKKETFGFRTMKNAPQCDELLGFEQDLNHLVANLEYRNTTTNFQRKLKNDIRNIQTSKTSLLKQIKVVTTTRWM